MFAYLHLQLSKRICEGKKGGEGWSYRERGGGAMEGEVRVRGNVSELGGGVNLCKQPFFLPLSLSCHFSLSAEFSPYMYNHM